MQKPKYSVGLIGYAFMGKAHSNAYRQAPRFFDLPVEIDMKAICGRDPQMVEKAAGNLGWTSFETDWRKVVEDPEIDIVDISVPGHLHAEIAIAAAEAGKIVFVEKPLANSLEEATRVREAVAASGRPSLLFHNYRKAPAVMLAHQLFEEGVIGQIRHFRASYLQDWLVDPEFPYTWRHSKKLAGSGAHGDLNAHLIDLARHLVDEIVQVSGTKATFINARPMASGMECSGVETDESGLGIVDVDDATAFWARFKSGAIGTFEASRFATGRKNSNRFEIYGSKGAICFDLERMNELELYKTDDTTSQSGFRTVQVTGKGMPHGHAYWPPGHIIGYEHTFIGLIADALKDIHEGRCPSPNVEDGYRNQQVLDAVERSCDAGGSAVRIEA